ncbi:MAG: hypothetical protein IJZ79_06495 [Bacilli bacterium]|nr:hypothetical protein [Bacilli bacterium]
MKYNVLIIGSDANAYYMARCYHEAYHQKAYVLAKEPLPYTKYSNILNVFYDNSIWNEDGFLKAIYNFKETHNNYQTLLISSNESYAKFISKNKEKLLKDNFIFNYPDIDIIESLIMKEKFYKTYQNYNINIPKTYYFNCSKEKKFKEKMTYPVILKPSNVIMYNHLSFEGKNKIYQIYNQEQLDKTISKIIKAGYTDYLIIQDFIPGDDSYLFDAVAYVDKNHQVKILSLAQIGLQEHSKNMVGNAAILINGYNQFGNTKEIESQMKSFLEDIKYQGFCEFDLKYDYRDNTYKVLEINARQGRSSYYLTPLGFNLVKVLIDDLIYNQELKYTFLKDKVLLSFVPFRVAKKYILNNEYKKEVLKLWKKNRVNPVNYQKDHNLKRKLYLLKKHFRYYKEYKNSYWKNNL